MDTDLLRRLLRAKDQMDSHSEDDWSVERLARISCVSPAHFARSFKKAFGIPPHRYLLSRRIERAKAMLRNTDQAVTDIAFGTGWLSMGTFGRTFRDITGSNPETNRASSRVADIPAEIPLCVLKEIDRPKLKRAVSEKRSQERLGQNDDSNNDLSSEAST
ncbi:AraC family transcriptional regulator [Cellvibrio zantedeschiae]|uniref:AraC family transcriptional regulator n=1 Tax=Cellvibrio zantedeschiae TaxID=1237077 RepID=A0ABQ3AUC8_9GAMM|nr:AraC family transcriptional regulator [Cellvibrio zantedeschiae]GGY66658.1 AraC family transcriptional regulator [Cellvibrio zantedeschiae]